MLTSFADSLDLMHMAPDELVAVGPTSYVFLVWHIVILSNAKQLPPRGRPSSRNDDVDADLAPAQWLSIVFNYLVISHVSSTI